jgi:hypothetical protein
MPYTSHGHAYGTVDANEPRPTLVARCGGPGLCTSCSLEAAPLPLDKGQWQAPFLMSAAEPAPVVECGNCINGTHSMCLGVLRPPVVIQVVLCQCQCEYASQLRRIAWESIKGELEGQGR